MKKQGREDPVPVRGRTAHGGRSKRRFASAQKIRAEVKSDQQAQLR
jgi:hypothetical protein